MSTVERKRPSSNRSASAAHSAASSSGSVTAKPRASRSSPSAVQSRESGESMLFQRAALYRCEASTAGIEDAGPARFAATVLPKGRYATPRWDGTRQTRPNLTPTQPQLTFAELTQQQPHDVAVGQRADLDEVAELVGQPQAPAVAVFEPRAGAAGQRLVEAAAVADLAHDHVVLVPDAQRALAAAVADAVRGDLVGREHEVAGAWLADAGLARVLRDERADPAERLPRDRVLGGVGGCVRERCGELWRRPVGAAVADALGGADPRVRALGLLDHLAVEVRGVVGADEVEAVGTREGGVEQLLVALALHELGGAAAGPDRLADAAQRAGAAADEVAPRR